MANPAMEALLDWLDPAREPVFVLLPAAAFQRLHTTWQLPALPLPVQEPDA